MKRLLTASLVVGLTVGLLASPATATQAQPPLGRWRGPCSTWEYGENLTPASFTTHPAKAQRQIDRLVVCIFDHYAPGNSSMALYVMRRESSGYPWALNSSSGCAGLFQHITWTGRAVEMLERWQFGPNAWLPTAFDPRANAMVAALMVAGFGAWTGGWGPWGM